MEDSRGPSIQSTIMAAKITRITAFFVVVVMSIGWIRAMLPHLSDEIWQDESYTLLYFSGKGLFYSLSDYHQPNNHMLFSILLSAWWDWGDSIVYTRSLLFISFILTYIVFIVAAARTGGHITAAVAAILFLCSSPIANYALELRGYALSWLFVALMLYALPPFFQGKKHWGAVYALAAALSVFTVPTNAMVCLLFLIWFVIVSLSQKDFARNKISQLALIGLSPLIGLMPYLMHWQNFKLHAAATSGWGKMELLSHLVEALISDFLLLVPMVVMGIGILTMQTVRSRVPGLVSLRGHFILVVSFLLLIPIWIFMSSSTPFPRNFLSFFPLFIYLLAYLISIFWQSINKKLNQNRDSIFLLVLLAAGLFMQDIKSCGRINLPEKNSMDLCQQSFHSDFYPSQVVNYLESKAAGKPIYAVSDFDGFYNLQVVLKNRSLENILIVHTNRWQSFSQLFPVNKPETIIATSVAELTLMANKIGVQPSDYKEIKNFGFFRVYGLK